MRIALIYPPPWKIAAPGEPADRADPYRQHRSRVVRTGRSGQGSPARSRGPSRLPALERTVQPTLPGPLPDDFALWSAHPTKPLSSTTYMRTPGIEGSQSQLKTRGRLKILSS